MRKKQHFSLIFLGFVVMVLAGLIFGVYAQTATNPYIKINDGNGMTKTRQVTLNIYGPDWAKYMKISNQADLYDADWELYKEKRTWYLDYGGGIKTVYIKFKSATGEISPLYRKDVRLNIPTNTSVDFVINDGEEETNSRYVTLDFEYTVGVEGYLVSNTGKDFVDQEFKNITQSVTWVLSSDEGIKTVYVQFLDANGKVQTVSKKITYKRGTIAFIEEGTLLKGQSNSIYYYGFDGQLHPFLNSAIYHSWYKDFADIRFVANSKLSQYRIGLPVCVRPGTWLLQFRGLPKVYSVLPGCQLKPILSEAEAYLIYGKDWNKRILELDAVYASTYTTLSYDVSQKGNCVDELDEDCESNIIDKDRDGLDSKTEADYGTSDKKADSDDDGITDYEEISYWFTDPIDKDTDGDGFSDLTEILSGYPPAGYGNLNDLLLDNYDYPVGSIIKKYSDKKLYYRHSNGYYYSVGNDSTTSRFKSNNLNANFIIESPFKIEFVRAKGSIKSEEEEIYYPTYLLAEVVTRM